MVGLVKEVRGKLVGTGQGEPTLGRGATAGPEKLGSSDLRSFMSLLLSSTALNGREKQERKEGALKEDQRVVRETNAGALGDTLVTLSSPALGRAD